MQFSLDAPELSGRDLVVRTGGLFGDKPQLIENGVSLAPDTGGAGDTYTLTGADDGATVTVQVRSAALDFVPTATVNGRAVALAAPLRVWEWVWCLLPAAVLLFLLRGLIGGVAGAFLAYVNLYLFRSQATPTRRYATTGLVTLVSAGATLALLWGLHHGRH